MIDCNAKFTWSIWVNGKEFPIDETNMIWEFQQNQCALNFDAWTPDPSSPDFILGDPFIREYCHIHDVKNAKIGLSKAIA
jgi:hypothetical protein